MVDHASHTKHLPTKEVFIPVTGYSGPQSTNQIGAWTGVLVDTNEDYAFINLYMPNDFDALEEARLAVIAYETLSPMYMRIITDYARPGQAYFEHNDQITNASLNTVLNRLSELDLEHAVDIRNLEAGDYLGVQVSRQVGHNTNCLVIGVRVKYKYR